MKNMLKNIVDAFVSNAPKDCRISSDAIGTIASTKTLASTWAIAFTLAFGFVGAAEAAAIANVTARQRYPWNGKVDIAYTASNVLAAAEMKDVDAKLAVWAIDKSVTPWTTNVAEESALFLGPRGVEPLTTEAALSNGAHRIVWDMNAQGISNKSDRVVFVVSAEGTTKPEPGVCFTALADGSKVTVDTANYNLEYSLDGGQTWASDGGEQTLKTGDKLLVRATSDGNKAVSYYWNDYGYECYPFKATGNLKLSGNIMYLLKQDGSQTELTEENMKEDSFGVTYGCFEYLFTDCAGITDASELKLANNTYSRCYVYMFSSCTSLTATPTLPAETMSYKCYASMFSSCASLTKVPALPATALAEECYVDMFCGCTSLVTVDENLLSATNLATKCYCNMFAFCSALTQAPNLPATDLTAKGCYYGMFAHCTSLTTAPKLGAISIPSNGAALILQMGCMFYNCSKLCSVTLPATAIATGTANTDGLLDWLAYAGTEATNPTLHVVKGMKTNASIKNNTPSNWTVVEDAE